MLDERTGAEIQDPAAHVLAEGRAVSLAADTRKTPAGDGATHRMSRRRLCAGSACRSPECARAAHARRSLRPGVPRVSRGVLMACASLTKKYESLGWEETASGQLVKAVPRVRGRVNAV